MSWRKKKIINTETNFLFNSCCVIILIQNKLNRVDKIIKHCGPV